jgi:hypothetical protein
MPENDDLRSALEEAFNEQEQAEQPETEDRGSVEDSKEPVGTPATESAEPESTEEADTPPSKEDKPRDEKGKFTKVEGKPPVEPERTQDSATKFRAPDSWDQKAKVHWDKLPPDVQQEVARRERDMVMTLQNTAGQRRLADDFVRTINPFMVFLNAENVHPLEAVRQLFGQAAILRIGTPAQKAQLVANVVKTFSVPIKDLDAALVGEEIPDQEGKIAQIIQQQLAPVNQFMQQVGQLRQEHYQRVDSDLDQEIETFAADKLNEYFYDVKDDMADIMEMAARQGRNVTLKQAYDRACKMNESVQERVSAKKREAAEKAKMASTSLPARGAPTKTPSKGGSVRDDLLDAFETVANRQ